MRRMVSVLKFIWPYNRPYRGRFVCGIFLSLLFALTNGLLLFGMKVVFDRLETVQNPPSTVAIQSVQNPSPLDQWRQTLEKEVASWLPEPGEQLTWTSALAVVLLLVGASFLRGSSNYLSSYCMRWSGEYTIRDLKRAVLRQVQSLSLDYFNRSARGDLLTRIDIDTANLNKAWGLGLTDLVRQPLTFLITLGAVIFLVDFRLTVMALVFFPICVVPVIILGNKVRQQAKRSRDTGVQQASRLIDFLSHVRTVKAYGLEETQNQEYRETSHRIAQANLKRGNAFSLTNPIIETVAALGFCAVLLTAFVLGSSMSHLAVFLGGFFLAYTPLKRLAAVHAMFQEASVSVDRLKSLFERKPSVPEPLNNQKAHPLNNELSFSAVSFSYAPEESPVLRDITFTLHRGEMLGLAGASGSGKSTLINLILRFYDPTSGTITWDGVDLPAFSIDSLRRQIALVSQEAAVFHRSVRDNVGFGLPEATDAQIREACEFAGADGFIRELPRQYDTLLGEQGVRLSGGQKQRISLARAFLRQASVLILDEATASLDAEAEREIQEVMNRLAADRAVVAIAHRLSTLNRAHRILVLERGSVVETGSYQECLKSGGTFAHLAALQGILPTDAK